MTNQFHHRYEAARKDAVTARLTAYVNRDKHRFWFDAAMSARDTAKGWHQMANDPQYSRGRREYYREEATRCWGNAFWNLSRYRMHTRGAA